MYLRPTGWHTGGNNNVHVQRGCFGATSQASGNDQNSFHCHFWRIAIFPFLTDSLALNPLVLQLRIIIFILQTWEYISVKILRIYYVLLYKGQKDCFFFRHSWKLPMRSASRGLSIASQTIRYNYYIIFYLGEPNSDKWNKKIFGQSK